VARESMPPKCFFFKIEKNERTKEQKKNFLDLRENFSINLKFLFLHLLSCNFFIFLLFSELHYFPSFLINHVEVFLK